MLDNILSILVFKTKGLLNRGPNPYAPVAFTHAHGDSLWQVVVARVPTADKQVA